MARSVLAVILFASLVAAGSVAAAPPDPFAGAWFATDGDGSNVRVQISMEANGVRQFVLTDDRTSPVCGGGPAQVIGTGTVSDSFLTVSGTLRCPNFTAPVVQVYEALSGTLVLEETIVFSRQGNT